ncbi:hypothetical protein Q5752_004036 [Cryptotrichosporon argae]
MAPVTDAVANAMPPPPVPAPSVHASPAPRMTRLPSLKQLSDRYVQDAHVHPSTPASSPLKVTTAVSPSPLYASPGRLKLPASAMMRSRSFSGTSPGTPGAGADALRSPTDEAAEMRRSISGIGTSGDTGGAGAGPEYIKGYRDIPSLHQIRARARGDGKENERGAAADRASGAEQGGSAEPTPTAAAAPTLHVSDELSPMSVLAPTLTTPHVPPAPTTIPSPGAMAPPTYAATPTPTLSLPSSTSPSTPVSSKGEHPLRHAWTLYYDSKTYKPEPKEGKEGVLADYELSLLTVGKFDTVEGFARHMNNLRLPSALAKGSNYHLFKTPIRPMWEDPANARGGKWVVLLRCAPGQPAHTLDAAWANLCMGLVGDVVDPEDNVCGVVASTRAKVDRIQVWTRGRDDADALNRLGHRIIECLALDGREADNVSIEFQYNAANAAANPPPGKFFHVPFAARSFTPHKPSTLAVPASAGLPAPPHTAHAGGAGGASGLASLGLGGAEPMRRLGSGQGSSAFAGPMGGLASPRSTMPRLPSTVGQRS